jgi:hypothetical protein
MPGSAGKRGSDAVDLAVQPEFLGGDEGFHMTQAGFNGSKRCATFFEWHGDMFIVGALLR